MKRASGPGRIGECGSGLLALATLALLAGCGGMSTPERDATPDIAADAPADILPDDSADAVSPPPVCDPDDPHPKGPACSQNVATDEDFDALSLSPTGIQYWERATKFMVPAKDDESVIPPLVQNANRYPLHMEFLTALFMPDLTQSKYMEIVTKRATRVYFAGNLVRIDDPVEGRFYGFTVYTAASMAEQLEPVEVKRVIDELSSVFGAGELAFTFEPYDAAGPAKAKAWINPGFRIYYPKHDDVTVEVYTPGVNYGYVRLYTLAQFETASKEWLFGFRDIVVIESVPFDIEAVVAAVVTGGRQWELSHINVRMARRGTPNFYVKDALAALSQWEGKLVRIEARKKVPPETEDSYTIAEATVEEAEAWWAGHQPKLEDIPGVDSEYAELDRVTEMDTAPDAQLPLVSRFGGKGANLALLYAFLDPKYQVPGFGIPFHYFEAFLDETMILDSQVEPPENVSLREYVHRLATNPALAEDAKLRHSLLAGLRAHIEDSGTVSPALVTKLAERIDAVFGGTHVPVRFRSSSNIEDALEFSGAGLYSSTTVCADDTLDSDSLGPSHCNPAEPEERSIERGVLRVWSSLYNDKAWDERDWYQVPQDAASMAILVTLAFPDEQANGVAFTGDPSDPEEKRYLVNVQLGDEKVVSADPAMIPEKDLLQLTDGLVTKIFRIRSSVLAEPGVPVMSDEQLRELGALMYDIRQQYPIDAGEHDPALILLDLEFKVEKVTLQLQIKQIRPFLMAGK